MHLFEGKGIHQTELKRQRGNTSSHVTDPPFWAEQFSIASATLAGAASGAIGPSGCEIWDLGRDRACLKKCRQ
jgi:hypothetical protein